MRTFDTQEDKVLLVLGCVGFGLYFFTCYSGVPDSGLEALSSSVWTRICRIVVTFSVALLFYGRAKLPRGGFFLALALQACSLLLMGVSQFYHSDYFHIVFVAQGYSVAVFSLLFAQLFASYQPNISRISIPLSFALAHCVLAVPLVVPPESKELVYSACLALGVGLLSVCAIRKQLLCSTRDFLVSLQLSELLNSARALRNVNWTLLVENVLVYGMGLVVFPILNGAVAQISYVADINNGLRDLTSQLFCICALLVVVVITALSNKPVSCKKVTIILVPVVVTALSVTPVLWNSTSFSSSIIIKCVYVIYTAVVWVDLAEKAWLEPEKSCFIFGLLGFPALSLIVGRGLGASFSAYTPLDFSTMAGFSIGAIWLILMIGMAILGLLLKSKNKQASSLKSMPMLSEPPASPSPVDKYLIISKEVGLSKRETEILVEFAQGRSAVHIGKSLSISEYTVKSHLRTIYKKAGVHNRQELLDLIEKCQTGRL